VTLLSAVLMGSTLDHLMIRMAETDDFEMLRKEKEAISVPSSH
jgi:hypothetical protein